MSKSHADLGLRSVEKSNSKNDLNALNFQTLFEILIETLSALEADIARNFNVISTKFSTFHNEYNKLRFEVETMNGYKSSNEKKFESIENRLTYCSERDDDIWKMVENLSSKVQSSQSNISEIETKIHEMAMDKLTEESGRDEVLNAKYASLKEVEEVLTQMQEYSEGLEERANKHEDRLRRLENYTQRANLEKNFERRCDQIEHDIREELDSILEKIDGSKEQIKGEIVEDFPS